MKKKKYGLVAGCGVLVVLCAVYVGVGAIQARSRAEKTKQEEAAKIYMTNLSDVTAVSYDKDGKELSFTKNNGTWKYDGDALFPVNKSRLDELADTVKKLPAIRKLDGGDSLSSYGLDKPLRKVTVKGENGQQQTILIGQATDSGDYYAAVDGQNVAYLISSSLFDDTSYSLDDLIQLEQFPAVSRSDIKTITVEKGGVAKQYVKKKLDDKGTDAWYLGSADSESNKLPDSSALDSLADSLTSLTVKSCANYKVTGAQLAGYGLDKPSAVLSYTYTKDGKDETFTLEVGKATGDDNNYYTRTKDSNFVNEIDKADLNKCLEADPEKSTAPKPEAGTSPGTEAGTNAETGAGTNSGTNVGANSETVAESGS